MSRADVHVVTGATSGIGRAIALRLAERGESLVLLGRDRERVRALKAEFPRAMALAADLAVPADLAGLGERIDGRIASLIHAAGVVELATVAATGAAAWEEHLAVNLITPAVLTRELLPHLRAGRGTAVFINSSAGLSANANWSAYAASKFGLRALADALRAEEQDSGVRVTTVFPSRTATPMQQKVHEQEGRKYDATRWIDPGTVAETVLHVLDLPAGTTISEVTVRPVVPLRA